MNLTVEQLSKATGLSVSTLRVYASQRNLGKKIGGKRIFSQADANALLKGQKKSPAKKTTKPRQQKAKASVNTAKIEPTPATATKLKTGTLSVKPPKASFWSRLFGGRKPQQKVSLLDAKVTK